MDIDNSSNNNKNNNTQEFFPELEGVFLVRNFVNTAEAQYLLDCLNSTPWTKLRNRRLQCFGGDPDVNAARVELPSWLQTVVSSLMRAVPNLPQINHVLVNEYKPGEGILPHVDGPLYFPMTATLSIGDAKADMKFESKLQTSEIGVKRVELLLRLVLDPMCLVVFSGPAYQEALHSIDNVRDGAKRISFTFREIQRKAITTTS
jgi:alkylated DNA repair protein alkB family protein 6